MKRTLKTARPAIWTTRDGREIPVTQLGDQHLVNCLKLIEEVVTQRKVSIDIETSGTDEAIKLTSVERHPDRTIYRYEKIVPADGGRYLKMGGTVRIPARVVSSTQKRTLSADRLAPYGVLVLEAVRRGLFEWSSQRKYLTPTGTAVGKKLEHSQEER
jgi:hypothetical protein